MSYFVRAADAIVNLQLEFGVVSEESIQQFNCKSGEVAGWGLLSLGDKYISQVYNCSSGTPVLIGNVQIMAGIDLTGGYFSSGCIPSGNPTDPKTVYYKVDYV